jgi:hypothetical protein
MVTDASLQDLTTFAKVQDHLPYVTYVPCVHALVLSLSLSLSFYRLHTSFCVVLAITGSTV